MYNIRKEAALGDDSQLTNRDNPWFYDTPAARHLRRGTRIMMSKRPQPPQPDRIRAISGSFSWIDHRFFRQGFDQGLTRLEKLLYLVLVAVSNRDGVSFYSDERLGEFLEIRHRHELTGARDELVARDLIAFKNGIYQVLDLPAAPKN